MRNVLLSVAIVAYTAWPAEAQVRRPRPSGAALNPRVFVSLNAAVQPVPDEPTDRLTFEENLETATVDIGYAFERAAMFEGGVAVRLWRRFGAGVALSRYSTDNATATVDARIPHPFFFDQPRTVTGEVGELNRSERAVHMQVVYIVPASGRLRVLLSAGPSRMSVEQDLVTDIRYDESFPFDTATFRSTTTRPFKGSAIGVHAGADVSYMLTRSIGVGGMVRVSRANIDIAGPDNRRVSAEAGGVQAGGGLRVVF